MEAPEYVVPPLKDSRDVDEKHKHRPMRVILTTCPAESLLDAGQGIFDDISPPAIQEVHHDEARPITLGIMAHVYCDVRSPDVYLGVREVNVVERVHLVASGCAFGMDLSLHVAWDDDADRYQTPVVPAERTYLPEAGAADLKVPRDGSDKGSRRA